MDGELSTESYPIKRVKWKIPNFYDLPEERGFYVDSPEFPFANGTWLLRLFPNCDEESLGDYIDFHLVRIRSAVPEHRISCRGGILYHEGDEVFTKSEGCYTEGGGVSIQFWRQYSEDLVDSDGAVTVVCDIHVTDAAGVETSSQTEPSQFEVEAASFPGELPGSCTGEEEVQGGLLGVWKLQSDYKTLLQSGEDSDVLLVVSGKEFRAHRCILRARSAVFSAMFKHETQEKESGKVVIDDLDPDSFPDFLNHLYTGRVAAFSDENAFSLYSAADKYDVQDLKSDCREYMQRNLSVDTFCDVMILALRYLEKELLMLATVFFEKNLDTIIVTPKWLRFMRDYYVQANELFIKAFVGKK